MAKQIIVNAQRDTTRIALLENGELAEFHLENPDHERTIGNLYLGRIKRVMPNIRAAFVDVGMKQDAFLHFSDLTDNLPQLLAFLEEERPIVGEFRVRTDIRIARLKRTRVRKPTRGTKPRLTEEERTEAKHVWLDSRHRPRRPARKPRQMERGTLRKLPHHDRLEDYLREKGRVLVKITKEPISNKGCRASSDISLAGRFLVLVPLADYIAVSKKISSFKEKRRLRALARSLTPDGFGVIVRTQAQKQSARTLDADLRLLVDKWRRIEAQLQNKPNPPINVYEDVNMVSSVVRDLFSDDYERILVDDPKLYRSLKAYVEAVAPHMEDAVQLHEGRQPIFEAVGIDKDVRAAFNMRVDMPSGGYLFIERTEAMHVVDVNSGRAGRGLSQEENAIRINMESARAIAKQLRLRDLGGIIVVDFIDLRDEKNRRKITDELRKEFRHDRAVTKVLPMSDFGLVQITRQRLRPSFTHYATADDGDGVREEARSSGPRPESFKTDAPLEERLPAVPPVPAEPQRQGGRGEGRRGESQRGEGRSEPGRSEPGRGERSERGRGDAPSGARPDTAGGEARGRYGRREGEARGAEGTPAGAAEPGEDRPAEGAGGRGRRGREGGRERAEREPDAPSTEARAHEAGERSPEGDEAGRDRERRRDRRRDEPDALVAKMQAWVQAYRTGGQRGGLVLRVHPFTAAYLGRVFPAHPVRWSLRYLTRIRVDEDANLGPFSFRFLSADTGEELTRRPDAPGARPADAPPADAPVPPNAPA